MEALRGKDPRESVEVLRSWIKRVEVEAEADVQGECPEAALLEDHNPWEKEATVRAELLRALDRAEKKEQRKPRGKQAGGKQAVAPRRKVKRSGRPPRDDATVASSMEEHDATVASSMEEQPRQSVPVPTAKPRRAMEALGDTNEKKGPPLSFVVGRTKQEKVALLFFAKASDDDDAKRRKSKCSQRDLVSEKKAEVMRSRLAKAGLRSALRAWSVRATIDGIRRRDSEAKAENLRFATYAGRSFSLWRGFLQFKKRSLRAFEDRKSLRRLVRVYGIWRAATVAAKHRAALARIHARARLKRLCLQAWRRLADDAAADRAAEATERALLAAKRQLEAAKKWHEKRLRSLIFIKWLRYAKAMQSEKLFQLEHAERRKQVQAAEAAFRQRRKVSDVEVENLPSYDNEKKATPEKTETPHSSPSQQEASEKQGPRAPKTEPTQKNNSMDEKNNNTKTVAFLPPPPPPSSSASQSRSRVARASSPTTKEQSLREERSSPRRNHTFLARGEEEEERKKQKRRRELAERTEARLRERRRAREKSAHRREEEILQKIQDARKAALRLEALKATALELAKQQWTVAKMHRKRSLLYWHLAPWKALVAEARLASAKARRWHTDGLLQRTWLAWLAARRRHLEDRLERRRNAVAACLRLGRVAATKIPFAKWLSTLADVRVRAVAVDAKRTRRLGRAYVAAWRQNALLQRANADAAWQCASNFADRLSKRHVLRTWRDAIALWRHEKRLNTRRQAKWDHVRHWMKD